MHESAVTVLDDELGDGVMRIQHYGVQCVLLQGLTPAEPPPHADQLDLCVKLRSQPEQSAGCRDRFPCGKKNEFLREAVSLNCPEEGKLSLPDVLCCRVCGRGRPMTCSDRGLQQLLVAAETSRIGKWLMRGHRGVTTRWWLSPGDQL